MKDYDYTEPGAYFVTMCTFGGECRFGEIVNNEMRLNSSGGIVKKCWEDIPNHCADVALDVFTIMPNHVHGIIVIQNGPGRGKACLAPTKRQFGNPPAGSLSSIIGSFKSAASRHVNLIRNSPGRPLWQRNFYEHVIRKEDDLNRIREYIVNNPYKWPEDENNPDSRRQERR